MNMCILYTYFYCTPDIILVKIINVIFYFRKNYYILKSFKIKIDQMHLTFDFTYSMVC